MAPWPHHTETVPPGGRSAQTPALRGAAPSHQEGRRLSLPPPPLTTPSAACRSEFASTPCKPTSPRTLYSGPLPALTAPRSLVPCPLPCLGLRTQPRSHLLGRTPHLLGPSHPLTRPSSATLAPQGWRPGAGVRGRGLCRWLPNRQEMGDIWQSGDPRNAGVPSAQVVRSGKTQTGVLLSSVPYR